MSFAELYMKTVSSDLLCKNQSGPILSRHTLEEKFKIS